MREYKIEITNGETYEYFLHDDNKFEIADSLQPPIDHYLDMIKLVLTTIIKMREMDHTKVEIIKL